MGNHFYSVCGGAGRRSTEGGGALAKLELYTQQNYLSEIQVKGYDIFR